MKRFVKCMNSDGYHSLTVGRCYVLLGKTSEEYETKPSGSGFTWPELFTVTGDFGEPVSAHALRFQEVPTVRACYTYGTLTKGHDYPLLETHEGNYHTPDTMFKVMLPSGTAYITYAWRFEPIQKETD